MRMSQASSFLSNDNMEINVAHFYVDFVRSPREINRHSL